MPLLARRSITFDNGSEFARHQNLSQTLDMKTWFCDPHSPWQRGSIENANGILRRDFPRKTDLADYSQQDIHDIVWAINTTPRKCLGFLTPAEAFLTHLRCCCPFYLIRWGRYIGAAGCPLDISRWGFVRLTPIRLQLGSV